jgi:hypothetical protein
MGTGMSIALFRAGLHENEGESRELRDRVDDPLLLFS